MIDRVVVLAGGSSGHGSSDGGGSWLDAVDGGDPADAAVSGEQRRELVVALSRLRAADREVLALRFLVDLSEAETAAALSVAAGTVKSRTSRALHRLRTVMDQSARVEVGDA